MPHDQKLDSSRAKTTYPSFSETSRCDCAVLQCCQLMLFSRLFIKKNAYSRKLRLKLVPFNRNLTYCSLFAIAMTQFMNLALFSIHKHHAHLQCAASATSPQSHVDTRRSFRGFLLKKRVLAQVTVKTSSF